ncbi:MAG: glycosyltransferase family 25 protein [Asticcacaulis sp.]|uniref:glycosyltransferase family 25 protein n=1 Tax=Asticcacaulis sp. TaxID=1872648 RepID=UPI0039E2462B
MKTRSNLTVRVINLESDTTRRKAVEDNLKDFNDGNWGFFKALKSDAPFEYPSEPSKQLIHYGRKLGPGEIGCFKSHVAVIQEFVSNAESDWLLVLEDDVWVDTLFDYQDTIALAEKANLNYIRLYAKRLKKARVVHAWGERQLIRYTSDPYGTQAYLINKTGARRFLQSLKAITLPIDDEMSRFWANGLEIYAVYPFPVVEKSAPSNIFNDRIQRMADRETKAVERFLFKVTEKAVKELANMAFLLKRRHIAARLNQKRA